jgi:tetratricopeptide (TPR) repeat protein
MGRFEEAIAAGARAVEVERSWKSLTAKASAHRAAEQCDLALSLFDEAARLDPDDTSALMEGARTLGEAGRFGEAATWFGRVVEREPDDTDALVWREYAAYCHTKDEAHVTEVRRILAEDPDHKLARRLLADMTD